MLRCLGLVLMLSLVSISAGCFSIKKPGETSFRLFHLEDTRMSSTIASDESRTVYALRSIQLVPYLRDRRVALRDDTVISYLDTVRWAEPLEDLLGQSLQRRLTVKTSHIWVRYPLLSPRNVEAELQINLIGFEGNPRTGEAVIRAEWLWSGSNRHPPLGTAQASLSRPWNPSRPEELPGLLATLLDDLIETITSHERIP